MLAPITRENSMAESLFAAAEPIPTRHTETCQDVESLASWLEARLEALEERYADFQTPGSFTKSLGR